jgi:hypothetical protein
MFKLKILATTTVNITLNDVISIDAGSTAIGGTVAFNYVTAADYNSDQTITKANSLKVTSTKNFNVKVKAGGPNFVNGSNSIPVDVLTIKAATAPELWAEQKRCGFICRRKNFSCKCSAWKCINTESGLHHSSSKIIIF